MTPEQAQARLRLVAVRDFLPDLRAAIDEVDAMTIRFIMGLDEGKKMTELAGFLAASNLPRRPSDTVAEYGRVQKDARLALFALAYAEGMSKADIGRAWGISRQLATVSVDEALGRADESKRT